MRAGALVLAMTFASIAMFWIYRLQQQVNHNHALFQALLESDAEQAEAERAKARPVFGWSI